MGQSIRRRPFLPLLFEEKGVAERAAEIGEAILAARSIRLTELAAQMRGSMAANYTRLQRFLRQYDPRQVLGRLFQGQAAVVLGDVTEIARPQARRTADGDTRTDGPTRGCWVLTLATPDRGRAIPCGGVTYSSRTIAPGEGARNRNPFSIFAPLKDRLRERPLVLDREFSYLAKPSTSSSAFLLVLTLPSSPTTRSAGSGSA